jgi:transposase InsO family protein
MFCFVGKVGWSITNWFTGCIARKVWEFSQNAPAEVRVAKLGKHARRAPGRMTAGLVFGEHSTFNGKFRAECLNEHRFMSLDEAQHAFERWRDDYNRHRPQSSLGNWSPSEFAIFSAGARPG